MKRARVNLGHPAVAAAAVVTVVAATAEAVGADMEAVAADMAVDAVKVANVAATKRILAISKGGHFGDRLFLSQEFIVLRLLSQQRPKYLLLNKFMEIVYG